MKNKKTTMKILNVFAVTTFIAGAFLIYACGNTNDKGDFQEDKILVSLGENFDVSKFYKGSKDVDFITLDDNIVSLEGDSFVGKNPGVTYIYSVVNGEKEDYIEIFVKDSFSEPTGISVSKTGLITWNNVYSYLGEEQYKAEFEISLNGSVFSSKENSYQLQQEGEYVVSVKASGQELVDESNWSKEVTLYYQKMGVPQDIQFTPSSDINSMKGTLSWNEVERAKYVVIIDGIKHETNNNYLELDFSNSSRKTTSITVEAIDIYGNYISSSNSIVLEKLSTPEITYKDGVLSWEKIDGAEAYHVIYSDGSITKDFVTNELSSSLEGATAGVYTVYVQALGGKDFINSEKGFFSKKVVKLGSCDVDYILGENYVDINLSTESEYIKNFKIIKNGEEQIVSILSGNSVTTRIQLSEGIFNFNIQVIPTIEDGNVLPLDSIESVLSSNLTETKTIYMLAKASNVIHYFDDSQNSIIEFDKIDNAENYEIYINDRIVNDASITQSDSKIKINVGIVDRDVYNLNDGENFNIKIVAGRNLDGISSSTLKTIHIFSKVNGNNAMGGDINSNKYIWGNIENAEYGVTLYRTSNSEFNIEGLEPIFSGKLEEASTQELSEGFYVIQIKTLSTDTNLYWNSRDVMEDKFIVSSKEEQIYFLDFYYDSSLSAEYSGYGIKFKIPAVTEENYSNPRKYEIFVNDLKILEAESLTSEQNLTYNFSNLYDFSSGNTKIELRSICRDSEMAKIYLPSEKSVLNVEKLVSPDKASVSTREDNILEVELKGNAQQVILSKDGVAFIENGEYAEEIDLSNYIGSFEIEAYYDKYKTFTSDERFINGTYYIESEPFIIHCQRDETPTNFSYFNKEISFEHTGKADKFNLIIKIKTSNDSEGKVWKTQIDSKNYNLDSLIDVLGSEFATYYSQKVEMDLDVYAYISQYVDEIFYISSINEVDSNKGMSHINVTQLKNVTDLTYNKISDKLIWSSNNSDEASYAIYMNNTLLSTVNTFARKEGDVCIYEYSLSSLVITPGENYEFKVVAMKKNSFSSNYSNAVVVKKLKELDSIRVYTDKTTHKTYIKWDLTTEQVNLIDSININGSSIPVVEQFGQIELATGSIQIKLISKNESSSILQYKDSDVSEFIVREANDEDYTNFIAGSIIKNESSDWLSVDNIYSSYIEWKAFEDDNVWSGNASRIDYSFVIYNSDNTINKIESLGDTNRISLSLDTLKNLVAGEYKFNVYASFEEYSLQNGEQGSYLSKYLSAENITIKKLAEVQNLQYIVDSTSKENYEDELNKKVRISWTHSDFSSEIYYEIKLLNSNKEQVYKTAVKGTQSVEILLKNISSLDVKYISVVAYSKEHIFSNITEMQVLKNQAPSATLSDAGVLTFNSASASNKYIVKVKVEGRESDYVVEGINQLNIYECFKLSDLINNVKGHKAELTVSIISVGNSQTLPSSSEDLIEKEILGQGLYDVYGEYIFFRNEYAEKVHILYDDGNGLIEIILDQQTILYEASNNSSYKYFSANKDYLEIDETQYMGGFRFKIPESWKGKTQEFTYYFEKSGMGNSWQNITTSPNSLTINSCENIEDISIGIVSSNNRISGYVTTAGTVSNLFIEVIKENESIFYGFLIGNEIPVWNIEENLITSYLPSGEYLFKIWNVVKNQQIASAYSDCYEFTYIKKENQISNIHIGESGYLEWSDSDETAGKYLIECGEENFIVNEKKFDLILLNNQNFELSIKKLYNLPFGGSVNVGEHQNEIYTITDPVEFTSAGLLFTRECSFKEVTDDAVIVLEVADSVRYKVFMEYGNKIYQVTKFEESYGGANYLRIRAIDLIDLLGNDFVANINQVKFAVTEAEKVKSPSISVNINLYKTNEERNVEQRKAGNKFDEYLIYNSDLTSPTKAILKVSDSSGLIVFDGIQNVINGYWVEANNAEDSGFYTTLPENILSSQVVNVIKISEILNELDMPDGETYSIKIAPIHNNGSIEQIEWLSTISTYYRLGGVDKLQVYEDGTKITWIDTLIDSKISQYMIKLGGTCRYISKDIFEISYEEFIAGQNLDLEIYAVNDIVGQLYSRKLVLKNVSKNDMINSQYVSLENGVLNLTWGEGLTSLERTALSNSSTKAQAIKDVYNSGSLIKVLDMIKGGYNSEVTSVESAKQLINNLYKAPVNFIVSELANERVEIKFVKEGNTKTAVVKVVNMLEYIGDEYIAIIKSLQALIDSTYQEYSQLQQIINVLSNKGDYYSGVASDNILFDEIGNNAGNNVEASDGYKIVMNQVGNPNRNALKSEDSTVINNVEVLSAPEMVAGKKDIESGDNILTSQYYIDFKPVGDIPNYRIVFKNSNGKVDMAFNIKKEDENWLLYYNEASETFNLSIVGEYIRIPLNTIGEQEGIDTKIEFGKDAYNVSIYACGIDDQFNSKTFTIRLTFLDQNSINVNKGKINFEIYNKNGKTFDSVVLYKLSGDATYFSSILKRSGTIISYLPENGTYDFISFLSRGYIEDNYTMYIDSPIYKIKEPFKLYDPSLSVVDGNIVITEDERNMVLYNNEAYQRRYTIYNDISGVGGGMLTDPIEGTYNYIYHTGEADYTGVYSTYKETEKEASIFYVQNNGSTGGLVSTSTEQDETLGKVNILQFSESTLANNRVVFQSSVASINAQMLQDLQITLNNNGDFTWNAVNSDVNGTAIVEEEGIKIVYRVTIQYCKGELDALTKKVNYEVTSSETKYTTKTEYLSKWLQVFEEDDYKYIVKVSAMAYSESNTGNGSIETIEGKTLYILNDKAYSNSSSLILRSNANSSDLLERMKEVNDINIKNGEITWTYSEKMSEDIQFAVYALKSGSVDEEIILAGALSSVQTSIGVYTYTFKPTTQLSANIDYNLIIKVVGKNKIASAETTYENTFIKLPEFEESYLTFTEEVTTTRTKTIIDLSGYKEELNYINGSKNYFKFLINITIGDQIIKNNVILQPVDSLQFIISNLSSDDNVNGMIYMPAGASMKLEITPQAGDDKSNILNAKTKSLTFQKVSWGQDKIEWNDATKEFIWSYGKSLKNYVEAGTQLYEYHSSTESYEPIEMEYDATKATIGARLNEWAEVIIEGVVYYIKTEDIATSVSYGDISDIKFNVEIVTREIVSSSQTSTEYKSITRTYYNIPACEFEDGMKGGKFAPILDGTLERFTVYAKKGEKSICSDALNYTISKTLDLKTFSGGDGTENNPYQIASADDFALINLRKELLNETKVYEETINKTIIKNGKSQTTQIQAPTTKTYLKAFFKQMVDLEINFDGILISDNFEGVYDGNGKNIVITANSSKTSDITLNENIQTKSLEFKQGVALFNKVMSSSVIKNLNIYVNFDYNISLDEGETASNYIFSGVAIENYGELNSIVCKDFVFTLSSLIKDGGGMLVSPIVGINRGTVIDCLNEASIEVKNNNKNQNSAKFSLSGIASSNYGTITGSGNMGNLKATITSSLELVIGGVVGYNKGALNMCYNTGNLQGIKNLQNYGSIGGLTNYTYGGKITYSFNNGHLFGNSSQCGGISYLANLTSLRYVFGYGDVNNEVTKNNKSNNLFFYSACTTYGEISNCYSYMGCATNMTGVTSLSANTEFVSGDYTLSLIFNGTYSFNLNISKA